jgi:hypothetical protein
MSFSTVFSKNKPKEKRLIDLLPKSNDTICYFDDLKNELTHLTIEITQREPDFFCAKFIEKKTEYLIRFATTGELIAIEYEHWTDIDLKFNYKDSIEEEGKKFKIYKVWDQLFKKIVRPLVEQ